MHRCRAYWLTKLTSSPQLTASDRRRSTWAVRWDRRRENRRRKPGGRPPRWLRPKKQRVLSRPLSFPQFLQAPGRTRLTRFVAGGIEHRKCILPVWETREPALQWRPKKNLIWIQRRFCCDSIQVCQFSSNFWLRPLLTDIRPRIWDRVCKRPRLESNIEPFQKAFKGLHPRARRLSNQNCITMPQKYEK